MSGDSVQAPLAGVKPRLLVVGWEGVDVSCLNLDRGDLPNLAGLIERGASGGLAAPPPPTPCVVWTGIATGLAAHRHGVTGPSEPRADLGGVQPTGQRSWRAPAFWEILAQAGAKTIVVGWPATQPADRWPGILVTDDFARARSGDPQDWPMPRHAVAPREHRAAIAALRLHPSELSGEEILPFLPDLAAIDQKKDKRPLRLALALAETASVHAAATHLMALSDWDLCAVRYSFLPKLLRNDPEGGEILRFLDMMLGRLLQLAGQDTQVLLVSPGGTGDETMMAGAASPASAGLFVAAGPHVRRDAIVHGATIFDVGPTALAPFGLHAQRCDGHVLTDIFTTPPQTRSTPLPVEKPVMPVLPADRTDATLDPAAARLIDDAAFAAHFASGDAELAAGDPKAAAAQFEAALHLRDKDYSALLRLALCRLRLEDGPGLRDAARRIFALDPRSPWSHLAMGAALKYCQETRAAHHFGEAERSAGDSPQIHLWLGEIRFRLKQLAAAEKQYRMALRLAPTLAPAAGNLGLVRLLRGDPVEAERFLRRALALRYRWPLAHHHLAAALSRQGREADAAAAMQTAALQDSKLTTRLDTALAEPLL